MNILAIFDNGEETLDRYTVVTDEIGSDENSHEMLGVSKDGLSFSQWTYGYYNASESNEHLGKRVDYSELDYQTAVGIANRLCNQ